MSLLRDAELVALLASDPKFIVGLPKAGTGPNDDYSAKSPIQPSSIDLHIGEITIPDYYSSGLKR